MAQADLSRVLTRLADFELIAGKRPQKPAGPGRPAVTWQATSSPAWEVLRLAELAAGGGSDRT
jgi:hypothetical protein